MSPLSANPIAGHPTDITFTERNTYLAAGIASFVASCYFYKLRWTRPFQAAVILTTPLLGITLMQTIRLNREPVVAKMATEEGHRTEAEQRGLAREALRDLAATGGVSRSARQH